MALSPGFADYVEELIGGFGPVQVRRMFGGAAVYRDGIGFGILDDDIFYIKADKPFGAELKARGCTPWSYSISKDGVVRDIAYWSLPETAADDGEEASSLVRRSFQIAQKAAEAKSAKKPRPAADRKAVKQVDAASRRKKVATKKTGLKPRAKR